MSRPTEPTVLLIGGSDSSSGAGIARDIHVCTSHAVATALAITAVTAQTDATVTAIHHVPADVIAAQIRTALESRAVHAIKIGMLGCRDTVAAVAASLPDPDAVPVILDPVLVSSSGHALLDTTGRAALRELLLPRSRLITPNLPEAAALLDRPMAHDETTAIEQAHALRHMGAPNVLIKGGHATGANATDILLTATGVRALTAARVAATLRGSGCMLASAIAARVASGADLFDACRLAKRYVSHRLSAAIDQRSQTNHGKSLV